MSEYLHQASYEENATQEWMRERSLDLMRSMKNPRYPTDRLTYDSGAFQGLATGRFYLPDGPWHAPTEHDESLSLELVQGFQHKGYSLDATGRPVHPWAADMLREDIGSYTGKGFYRYFGANETADPVMFRYDQPEPLVLLVQRRSGLWAFAGGHVDPGEAADKAALREAREETLPGAKDGEGYELYDPVMIPIYSGPVADPRATLNAWPGNTTFAIHLNPHATHDLPVGLFQGDPVETLAAGWFTIEEARSLPKFGSHEFLFELGLQTIPAEMLV